MSESEPERDDHAILNEAVNLIGTPKLQWSMDNIADMSAADLQKSIERRTDCTVAATEASLHSK